MPGLVDAAFDIIVRSTILIDNAPQIHKEVFFQDVLSLMLDWEFLLVVGSHHFSAAVTGEKNE